MVNIFQNILSVLGSAGNFLFISFMVLVFTIILLVEYHSFKKSLVRFIPNKFLEVGLRTIYNIEQQISKYLRGQILAASSVSILSILGLIILNKSGANITLVAFIGWHCRTSKSHSDGWAFHRDDTSNIDSSNESYWK